MTTPGTRAAIVHGLRLTGMASYSSLVMLVWVTVVLTSTTGDSPLTLIVSCSVPTPSSTSRRRDLRHPHGNPLLPERCEARKLVCHFVGAWGKDRELVAARYAGDGDAGAADQRRACHGHGDTGQHPPCASRTTPLNVPVCCATAALTVSTTTIPKSQRAYPAFSWHPPASCFALRRTRVRQCRAVSHLTITDSKSSAPRSRCWSKNRLGPLPRVPQHVARRKK